MASKVSIRKATTRRRLKEKLVWLGLFGVSDISALVLFIVFGFLLVNAIPAFTRSLDFLFPVHPDGVINLSDFLFGTNWDPTNPVSPAYGIVPMFVATLLVSLVAACIAIPIGIGCTIYVAEIASPRVRSILKPAIEVLAGIPSVVYGFFALVILSQWLAGIFDPPNKLNLFNGGVMLAVMMIPIMVSLSEDAINSVPRHLREASYALGLTRWETIRGVVVPAAASGIVAAIVLSIGRAIGETMTVLMATGNARALTFNLFQSGQTMTAVIASETGEVPFYSLHYDALFAIGVVLFVLTFVINLLADWIMHRVREEYH